MSQYETNETTASGGTSFAADSPNVMARLPDIGAPDRDLDRDLPIQGRGRVLSSRLAMPILMGAAVVLLFVALAPFIFGGREQKPEMAEAEPWQSDTTQESPTSPALKDETSYAQPSVGKQWNDGSQPPAWDGNTVPPNWQNRENGGYATAPNDLSRADQPPNGQYTWPDPNQLAPQYNPPQPDAWNSANQPPLVGQATPWQNQARQPVPWAEPSPPSPATEQPNASSARPLMSSRPTSPGGYQGYQRSPSNPGVYTDYTDPSIQQPYSGNPADVQSITNRAATINPQNPGDVPVYGARETQVIDPPYADDSGPQPLDRWSPPGAANYSTQDLTSPYPYDPAARTVNPTYPPSSHQPSVASNPYQPAPGLASQPRPEAYPQLGASPSQPPMTSSPPDSYGYPTARTGQPATNNFYQNQPDSYSAAPAYGSPAPSGYGYDYSVPPANPGAAQYGSRSEPTTRF
jgi:hypothetical protein